MAQATISAGNRRLLLVMLGAAAFAQVAYMGALHLWPALPQLSAFWVFLFWLAMLYADARTRLPSKLRAFLWSASAAMVLAVLAYALGSPAV